MKRERTGEDHGERAVSVGKHALGGRNATPTIERDDSAKGETRGRSGVVVVRTSSTDAGWYQGQIWSNCSGRPNKPSQSSDAAMQRARRAYEKRSTTVTRSSSVDAGARTGGLWSNDRVVGALRMSSKGLGYWQRRMEQNARKDHFSKFGRSGAEAQQISSGWLSSSRRSASF